MPADTSPLPVGELIERLRYIATILQANRHKFAVPDHIPQKVANVLDAANRLAALEALSTTVAPGIDEDGAREAAATIEERNPVNGSRRYWRVIVDEHPIDFHDKNEFSVGDAYERANAFAASVNRLAFASLRASVQGVGEASWQDISSAPRDGTPILLDAGNGDFPFIAYWGHVGRYTSTPKMWIGHEYGAMGDGDVAHWMPIPAPHSADAQTAPPLSDPHKGITG